MNGKLKKMSYSIQPQFLFDLRRVSYRYNKRFPAVCEVDLSIQEGERVAILGPTRSGKSSLLKIMQGQLFPEDGSFRLFGDDVISLENLRTLRSFVGFSGQISDEQLFRPTVLDNLVHGSGIIDFAQKSRISQIDLISNLLGIQDILDRSPAELSGGEKKIVSFASSLLGKPRVLILDEPTSGLSHYLKEKARQLLINSEFSPKTLILSTNDLDLARNLCERAVLLSPEHRKIADGPTSKILEDINLLVSTQIYHEHLHHHDEEDHVHQHDHDERHDHEHDVAISEDSDLT